MADIYIYIYNIVLSRSRAGDETVSMFAGSKRA